MPEAPQGIVATPIAPRPTTEVGRDYFAQRDAATSRTSPQQENNQQGKISRAVNPRLTSMADGINRAAGAIQGAINGEPNPFAYVDQEVAAARAEVAGNRPPANRVEQHPTPNVQVESQVLTEAQRRLQVAEQRVAYSTTPLSEQEQKDLAALKALDSHNAVAEDQRDRFSQLSEKERIYTEAQRDQRVHDQLLDEEETAKNAVAIAQRNLAQARTTNNINARERTTTAPRTPAERPQNTTDLNTRALTQLGEQMREIQQAIAQLQEAGKTQARGQAQPQTITIEGQTYDRQSLPALNALLQDVTIRREAVLRQLAARPEGPEARPRQRAINLEAGYITQDQLDALPPADQELLSRNLTELSAAERHRRLNLVLGMSKDTLTNMRTEAVKLKNLKVSERNVIQGILAARQAFAPTKMLPDIELLIANSVNLGTDAKGILRTLWETPITTLPEPWDVKTIDRVSASLTQVQEAIRDYSDPNFQEAMMHFKAFHESYEKLDRKSPMPTILKRLLPFVQRKKFEGTMAWANDMARGSTTGNLDYVLSMIEDPLSVTQIRQVAQRNRGTIHADDIARIKSSQGEFQITSTDPETQLRQTVYRDFIKGYYDGFSFTQETPQAATTTTTRTVEPINWTRSTTAERARAAAAAESRTRVRTVEPDDEVDEVVDNHNVLKFNRAQIADLLVSQAGAAFARRTEAGEHISMAEMSAMVEDGTVGLSDVLRRNGFSDGDIEVVIEDVIDKQEARLAQINADASSVSGVETTLRGSGISITQMTEAAREAFDPATGVVDNAKLAALPSKAQTFIRTGLATGGFGFLIMLGALGKKREQRTT